MVRNANNFPKAPQFYNTSGRYTDSRIADLKARYRKLSRAMANEHNPDSAQDALRAERDQVQAEIAELEQAPRALPVTGPVRFHTEQYQAAHGRTPRGRGGWAFAFGRRDAEAVFIPGSMTYAEAKRWALAQARSRGVADVWVCS